MLSDELQARIALLNRGTPSRERIVSPPQDRDLESLVPGEVAEDSGGCFYRIRRLAAEIQSTPCVNFAGPNLAHSVRRNVLDHELDCFAGAFPSRVLYLDLETCGFSGAPLFLIGLLRLIDGAWMVEQLLARDYGEEPAVLRSLWACLPNYDVLVTFNGKTFDWPFVVDRTIAHRLPTLHTFDGRSESAPSSQRSSAQATRAGLPLCPPTHCDLLPLARRYWKDQLELPNCRLQTLEAALCQRYRGGDIPGHLIPEAYHAFVRSGDARQIELILQHNAADLITLAQLSLLLVEQLLAA